MDLINKQFDSTEHIFSAFSTEQDTTDRIEVKVFPLSTYPNIRNIGLFLYDRILGTFKLRFHFHHDVPPCVDSLRAPQMSEN